MVQEMIASAKPRMEAALSHFLGELKNVRTGRAAVSMLDSVTVPYYGTPTPLKALATLTTPDAAQIVIQPFDVAAIKDIRTAILEADLGFNPSDDGRMLRIAVPPLTTERREELAKRVGKLAEEARISLRQIRGDIWDKIQKAHKESELTDENREWGRGEIDELTSEYNKKVEQAAKDKEAEIRAV